MRRILWKYYDAGAGGSGGGGGAVGERQALIDDIKNSVRAELEARGIKNKDSVGEAVTEALKGLDLEGLRSWKKADNDAQAEQVRNLATEVEKIKNRSNGEPSELNMSIRAQLKKALEDNAEAFKAFRENRRSSFGTDKEGQPGITLVLRAPTTMTVGGSTGGAVHTPAVEVLPGLVDLARNQPFIEQYSNTAGTSNSRIAWTEKFNPQGQAQFIGEGGLKPLISFEIREYKSYAKKVADKIKVSTEMLDDIEWMAAEIEKELMYQVDIKVDAELLAGAGDGTENAQTLKGLTQYAGGYVLNTVLTTTPNNFDAIRAAIAQIVSLNFRPNYVFINPIDSANMDLTKDGEGRPLELAYKANGRIYGIVPIETNQIPVGSFLIGDMTRFKIRNYKPFSISYGWVNDDFEKNLVTVIGERRLHAFVAFNDTGAFIYDTFADVKTAITAP